MTPGKSLSEISADFPPVLLQPTRSLPTAGEKREKFPRGEKKDTAAGCPGDARQKMGVGFLEPRTPDEAVRDGSPREGDQSDPA